MIGVFDSGHGGLTVQHRLNQAFPAQGFVYLGDHANAPYGGRPARQVQALTRAGVEHLFTLGCRLVLIGCNTAAIAALRRLQQDWLPQAYPGHRLLGIVVPTVEAITGMPWVTATPAAATEQRRIGVFATALTVASNAYPREIETRAPGIEVTQQACPGLVDAIEDGADEATLLSLVKTYVLGLLARLGRRRLDAVLLGCTHFPLVAPLFRQCLPVSVEILSQPDLVASSLAHYLARHPDFTDRSGGGCRYLTTGDPLRVSALAERFIGHRLAFAGVCSRAISA